jgi:putative photosynthetic complex assembly protein
MSHAHEHGNVGVPRPALMAMGALVLFALLATTWVRLSGVDIRAPDAPVAQERALRFEDRPDGSIAVLDPKTGNTIDTVTGQSGFVRGTLRGLARERKRMGLGAEQPFVLMGRADGRLTLKDPATGRVVDLESFGPLNAGVFARMLASPTPN